MAIFHDGISDNLQSSMLYSIQWQIRYGVMIGKSPDSPAWQQLLGDAEYGTYSWVSSGMTTTSSVTYIVQWNRDDGDVCFRLVNANQPL